MKTWRNGGWLVLLALIVLAFAVSCGDDDDDDDSGDDDTDPGDDDASADDDDDAADDDDDDTPPPPGCDTLVDGWNEGFLVNGEARNFFIDLPDGVTESWPWPVVFSFYGVGDTPQNWRRLFTRTDFQNDETMPAIWITPEDSGASFFGWDMIDVDASSNKEAALFDALIEELDTCWGVDPDHIHLLGHSAGGITADMIAVLRPDEIASVGTHSGAYASDPDNLALGIVGRWPDLVTDNKYPQVLVHGSHSQDVWMGVINFHNMNVNDQGWLNGLGHDVVICNHGGGHNDWPSSFDVHQYVEFFADHPKGTFDSPYMAGLPGDYPDYCQASPAN